MALQFSSLTFLKYLFIYLAASSLRCDMWDLVPWPGIEPRTPALGAQRLRHWTIREAPPYTFFIQLVISNTWHYFDWNCILSVDQMIVHIFIIVCLWMHKYIKMFLCKHFIIFSLTLPLNYLLFLDTAPNNINLIFCWIYVKYIYWFYTEFIYGDLKKCI